MKFDQYTFKARLLPTYLVILPLVIMFFAIFPQSQNLLSILGGVFVSFGLTALLAQAGRDAGKRSEPGLFAQWGGIPTDLMLSHVHSGLEKMSLARYHKKLESLIAGIKIPTAHEENFNPESAMQTYSSCVKYLRENTRNKNKFGLVFSENVNYGFRRNLWGMKPAGIFTSIIGLLGCAIVFAVGIVANNNFLPTPLIGGLVCSMMLTFWIFRISPEWVKIAADAYAERLICSLDIF